MCDTPSHSSDHLWLIWKESIQSCRWTEWTRQAGQRDGRTDRRTDGWTETNIPHGGYNKITYVRTKLIFQQTLKCDGELNTEVWTCLLSTRCAISTIKHLIQVALNPKLKMFLVSSCICLCPIHWSHVLNREWRCSWNSTNRGCSNYIWVINKSLLPTKVILY